VASLGHQYDDGHSKREHYDACHIHLAPGTPYNEEP
jgi:hypothetical protein